MEYITTHLIFELCTGAERMTGYSFILRCWEQDHSWEEGENQYNEGSEGEEE